MGYLKEKIKESGISQSELAKKTHLTEASISRYCNGQRKLTLVNAYTIAKALNVDIGEFVEGIVNE